MGAAVGVMDIRHFEQMVEVIKYQNAFIQAVRGLLFFTVAQDESRDRTALVALAKYVKDWAKENPQKIKPETIKELLTYADNVIQAGVKADGPPMPAPLAIILKTDHHAQ